MQTQKEFTKELKETVNKLIGANYRAEVHSIEKVNIGTLQALVILGNDSNISPSFYIEELYKSYLQGKATIEEMAKDIVEAYCHNIILSIKENRPEIYFNNREWVQERLFLQLVNSSKNKKLLKDSVHLDCSELSLVLYIIAADDESGIGKVRVTKAMLDNFGWDEKDILSYALENTVRLFPYEEFSLYELLSKITGCTDIPGINIVKGESEMMILTNSRGMFGATTVFYPGVLKELADRHNTSLFLLPSSIHEFIVLEDDGIYDAKELEKMVQEVNVSAVSPEDVLSDNIYYYGRNSGMLSVFHNGKLEEVVLP